MDMYVLMLRCHRIEWLIILPVFTQIFF